MPWTQAITGQPRIRGFLDRLAGNPPHALLMEGGSGQERMDLSLFWAARLHCQQPDSPCGTCRFCLQIFGNTFRDLFILGHDLGTISIEMVREVRLVLSDPPSGSGPRVVILAAAQNLTTAAANALLKSLEEPWPGNVFVLLAPTREILLPTLVSRCFVLTLGWSRSEQADEHVQDWLPVFIEFVQKGRGEFLQRTAKKGAVDLALAGGLLRAVQQSLVQMAYGQLQTPLTQMFQLGFNVYILRQVDVLIDNALKSLDLGAQPAIVLEWVALGIWELMHE